MSKNKYKQSNKNLKHNKNEPLNAKFINEMIDTNMNISQYNNSSYVKLKKNLNIDLSRIKNNINIDLSKMPLDFNPDIYKKLNKDLFNLTYDELINHYFIHGRSENRLYKISNKLKEGNKNASIESINYGKKIDNKNLLNLNNDIVSNNVQKNIIISISSTPSRILSDNLTLVIESLINQTYKPKYIIINICEQYLKNVENNLNDDIKKRLNDIAIIDDTIIINFTDDNGPITKITGLYKLLIENVGNISIKNNDIVLFMDDDWIMSTNLLLHHMIVYELYNCDCVFVNEENMNIDIMSKYNIYCDNYQSYAHSWLSYSFKIKYIESIIK